MRIIGEIDHPTYKISVLKMNEKVTLQIEDRLVSQSYAFRDGTGVQDLESAQRLLTKEFLQKVDNQFKLMNQNYMSALESLHTDELDSFDII